MRNSPHTTHIRRWVCVRCIVETVKSIIDSEQSHISWILFRYMPHDICSRQFFHIVSCERSLHRVLRCNDTAWREKVQLLEPDWCKWLLRVRLDIGQDGDCVRCTAMSIPTMIPCNLAAYNDIWRMWMASFFQHFSREIKHILISYILYWYTLFSNLMVTSLLQLIYSSFIDKKVLHAYFFLSFFRIFPKKEIFLSEKLHSAYVCIMWQINEFCDTYCLLLT